MIDDVSKYIKQQIAYWFMRWQEYIPAEHAAVVDEEFRVISPGGAGWNNPFMNRGWKNIRKTLSRSIPVKIMETEHYIVGYFCQEPPLFLVADKKSGNLHTGVIKLFAELLYREIYVKPSLNHKLKFYEDLFAAIKGIGSSYIRTTDDITLEKWYKVVEEKFNAQYIAVYLTDDFPGNTRISCLYRKIKDYPACAGEDCLPRDIHSRPQLNLFRDACRKQAKAAGSNLIVRAYHEQTIFFCILIKEGRDISAEDKTYLDTYIHCILLELYPRIFTNLSHVLAQKLTGTLCMELFDPLTSSQLLINQLYESIAAGSPGRSHSLLVKLEQQLAVMDQRLSNSARINIPFPAAPIIAESKALIFDALACCPELEKKCIVDKNHIDSSLFIAVQKNAFMAVLCEIFKNILLHAYPGKEPDQKTVAISAKAADGMLLLTIANNGKKLGNPAENSRYIFEPGWKEEKGSPRPGMGLAFAWFIITKIHQGSIETGSDPAGDFRITIKMPLNVLQPAKDMAT